MRLALVFALLLGACSPPADEDPGDVDGKEDRPGGLAFREVDPTRSSPAFRRYIRGALALLEEHDAPIAALTLRSITEGRVLIDELTDLTCWDFERARHELTRSQLAATDYVRLRDPASDVAAALSAEIDGYMWSNRIYVSRGLPMRRLAATLIHEVNHVINRSEVGYWDDLPTSAFLHEYRAFHAETLFDPGFYEGVDLVQHVIELYELDGDLISDEVLASPLTPRLLPDADAWGQRRPSDDPRDVEEDCPGWD